MINTAAFLRADEIVAARELHVLFSREMRRSISVEAQPDSLTAFSTREGQSWPFDPAETHIRVPSG